MEDLIKIFGNKTRSLEILYLISGIKKAARLDANETELDNIKKFCEENGLHLEISDFKVIKIMDEGKGFYSNTVKRVPWNFVGDGLSHVYISKDEAMAKFLKLLENKNDDEAVGKALGYPKCCVDFFVKNKEKQQKIQNDYILPALENSEGLKFPFYLNYAARYFDAALLSHFPHSFNCKKSVNIAKRNLECIQKNSKELAGKIKKMLKCAVLYTENKGVFLFQNYKLDSNTLEFNDIQSTIDNELLQLLNENKRINIVGKNRVNIGGKILEDVGFMVFE